MKFDVNKSLKKALVGALLFTVTSFVSAEEIHLVCRVGLGRTSLVFAYSFFEFRDGSIQVFRDDKNVEVSSAEQVTTLLSSEITSVKIKLETRTVRAPVLYQDSRYNLSESTTTYVEEISRLDGSYKSTMFGSGGLHDLISPGKPNFGATEGRCEPRSKNKF